MGLLDAPRQTAASPVRLVKPADGGWRDERNHSSSCHPGASRDPLNFYKVQCARLNGSGYPVFAEMTVMWWRAR
jgi:hypothetical protein